MPNAATAAETAAGETVRVETRLGIAWVPPDYYQAPAGVAAQVAQVIRDEVPAAILEDWRNGRVAPLYVEQDGDKSAATLRAYAQQSLKALNQQRPATQGAIGLNGGDQAMPRSTTTVYIGGELVYVSTFSLNMERAPWVPITVAETPPVALALQISWNAPKD